MPDETNFREFKRGVIESVNKFKKSFVKKATSDIRKKLINKGLSNRKVKIDNNLVFMDPKTKEEYENGKIYFNEVYNEVDSQSWVDTL